jgi:hypothetical protein
MTDGAAPWQEAPPPTGSQCNVPPLDIVRLRYGDAPSFVDVSSVISAYTFQGQVSAAGQFSSNLTNAVPSHLASVSGTALYFDRPTITYTPLSGDKFARSLGRPRPRRSPAQRARPHPASRGSR